MGHIKIIQSGSSLEVYEYEKEIVQRRKSYRIHRKKWSRKRSDWIPFFVRSDNINRKTKAFTRLIRSNIHEGNAPILLTLTFAVEPTIREGYKFVTLFFKKLRRAGMSDIRFISVPEFGGKKGRLHFHSIVWGLDSSLVYSERETRYLAGLWGQGFLDCIQSDGSVKLAGYLAKYLSKSLTDVRFYGCKMYSGSRNLIRPYSSSGSAVGYLKEIWGIDLSTAIPLQEKEFPTQWLGKGRYRRYEIKFKENV